MGKLIDINSLQINNDYINNRINTHTHTVADLTGGYLNIHPESNRQVFIPFLYNDIAFLTKRGGSATIKYDGVLQDINLDGLFDLTPRYTWLSTSPDIVEIELTLHRLFQFTCMIYIEFGAVSWCAKNIKIEAMNSNTQTVYTTILDTTNNSQNYCWCSHNSSTVGINKIKITLSNFIGAQLRIAQIGVVGYNSYGLSEGFLLKSGAYTYGDIFPFNNNGAKLGTNQNYWESAYITNIYSSNINTTNSLTINSGNKIDLLAESDINVECDMLYINPVAGVRVDTSNGINISCHNDYITLETFNSQDHSALAQRIAVAYDGDAMEITSNDGGIDIYDNGGDGIKLISKDANESFITLQCKTTTDTIQSFINLQQEYITLKAQSNININIGSMSSPVTLKEYIQGVISGIY